MTEIRPKSALPWAWTGFVTLCAGAIVAIGRVSNAGMSGPEQVAFVLIPSAFAGLGAVIRTRRPGNRIAWIFFWMSAGILVDALATLPDISRPGPVSFMLLFAAVWSNVGLFITLVAPIALMLFLFPTGRFLTRRWSWGGWATAVVVLVPLVGTIFAEEVGPPREVADWRIENPIGFIPTEVVDGEGPVALLFGVGLVGLVVGGVMAMITRYRRASAVQRAQIKWVAYAGILFMAWLAAALLNVDLWADSSLLSTLVFLVVLGSIPVSVTLAITRFRLFEIDRIISRTVGYALVMATLILIYSVAAVWLPGRLIGDRPPIFVASATLLAAGLFSPIRRRVLARVDRYFYRSSYDAERVLSGFADRLRTETDAEVVSEELKAVIVEAIQPASLGLWVRNPSLDDARFPSVG